MASRRLSTRQLCFGITGACAVFLIALFVLNPSLNAKTRGFVSDVAGHIQSSNGAEEDDNAYNSKVWWFQKDLDGFPLPEFNNITKLHNYPPHNYRGAGQKAYATFFATRNGTEKDPYFIAAQQFVYRMLWDPEKKSAKHPVIVFVPPFITTEQRQYFSAAGAIVRELNLREFEPNKGGLPERLQDMFTKLELWRQTDFSQIFYIDSDAIPYANLDDIFDFPVQTCIKERLSPEDSVFAASICNYNFAAWPETVGEQLNAGVMLLKPNRAMYRRLVRDSKVRTGWKEDSLEQAFLDYEFADNTPFPAIRLPREWNGGVDMKNASGYNFRIVHTKVWSLTYGEFAWASGEFNKTWDDMRSFYASEEFERQRDEDRRLAFEQLQNEASAPTEKRDLEI